MPEQDEVFLGVIIAIFFIALAFFSFSEALEILDDVIIKTGETIVYLSIAAAILGFLYFASKK